MVVAASVTSLAEPDSARVTAARGGGRPIILLTHRPRRAGILLIAQAAKLRDQRGEALPLDELHRVIVDAALAADRMHRHDPLVLHVCGRQRLGLETLEAARVDGRGERQDLERDPPPERNLLGLVDDPHPPPADLAQEAEVAELADLREIVRPVAGSCEGPRLGRRAARSGAVSRATSSWPARNASRSCRRSGCSARSWLRSGSCPPRALRHSPGGPGFAAPPAQTRR